MTRPRVLASHSSEGDDMFPTLVHDECCPSVEIAVEFNHGDGEAALVRLRRSYEQVVEQIASTM